MLLIALSKYLKSNIYIDLGKETLIIYLTHMQIAGIINTRLPNIWIVDIIKPYFVLMLMYFSIYYTEKILNKNFFKRILPFLGLRNR